METRTVKFNLKQFIEDYDTYSKLNMISTKEKLVDKFLNYYNSCSLELKNKIKTFINNNKIATQYSDLKEVMNNL